jgi:hypothetical protein
MSTHLLPKNIRRCCRIHPAVLALLCLGLPALLHASTTIRSSLGASTIPVGGHTFLTVQVEGATRADVDLPRVPGLSFRNSGTSQNTSIINGKVSRSVEIRVAIIGEQEGTYAIPSFTVNVEGTAHPTQPLNITVSNAGSMPGSTSAQQGSQANPDSDTLTAEDIRQIARVIVEIPDGPFYLGQKVPIRVELWVNSAHRFDNLSAPSTRNDSILTDALGQEYSRNIDYINQERFEIYSWNTHFTAMKSGASQLQYSTEVTLLVRARRQTMGLNSLFDSDFFSPSFRRLPLLIQSDPSTIEILPLPSPEPDGFSGAIGSFNIHAEASPRTVRVGDPITIDISISGHGNFERVNHPGLTETPTLRTYQPESRFEASDADPSIGTKTFKQAIIPMDPAQQELPPIEFTYFDTDQGTYRRIHTAPIPVTITGEATRSDGTAATGTATTPPTLSLVASDGWIPLQIELDTPPPSLRPLIRHPGAWMVIAGPPALLWIASLLLPTVLVRHSNNRLKELQGLRKKLKTFDRELENAIQHGDSAAFVRAAATVNREVLALLWSMPPASITTADAKKLLPEGFPALLSILRSNDTLQYAGSMLEPIDMRAQYSVLQSEWAKLIEQIQSL